MDKFEGDAAIPVLLMTSGTGAFGYVSTLGYQPMQRLDLSITNQN